MDLDQIIIHLNEILVSLKGIANAVDLQLRFGLVTGMVFGVLLQRAQVIRYDKQLAALRFKDFTILKFMMSAIIVGMIGTYFLYDQGLVKLSIKPTILGGTITGGVLFGVGWALLGYCPGTSVGALGEGRTDALWGILGAVAGAALYAEMYPYLQDTLLKMHDYGKITLPQLLGVNHWIVIAGVSVVFLLSFVLMEKKGL
ncbi:MAG: YeeE/YedE thiosulfate transporter family protein [Synergistaceae bacterium]|nr:YeeE/YedE thiosulfate transporter family protein [Synergistaceae bacterium]